MDVAVVVPSWNGADLLPACLDSLLAQDAKDCTVIVVDNGSSDGSPEIVADDYTDVVLLRQPSNLGFAGGVNVGIHHALAYDARYVALFNNDAVAQPGWLSALVEEADAHPEAGIVTSLLTSGDGTTIDSTGDFYSWWGYPFPRGRGEPNDGRFGSPEEVFGASGGATLYRADMLREIGLFDEAFFAYYEDVDLSFRAQLAGWRVRYTPKAVAWHHQGSTSSRINGFHRFHSVKNFFFLYMKNMPRRLWWRYLPRFAAGFAMLCAGTLRMGLPGALCRALGRIATSTPRLVRDRRRVQALRTVPVERIDELLYKDMPSGQVRFFRVLRAIGVRR